VHRDLKPENILFKRPKANDIVITDLGLATRLYHYKDKHGKNKGEGFVGGLPSISSETGLPGYHGTMGYTAPEVLLGRKQGVKIDSWAIGYVLFYSEEKLMIGLSLIRCCPLLSRGNSGWSVSST
jgi:calcium/calmodulin-dependent protein kinase I